MTSNMPSNFSLGNMNNQELMNLKNQCTNQIAVINSLIESKDATPDRRFQNEIDEAQKIIDDLTKQSELTQNEINKINDLIKKQDLDINNANKSLIEKRKQLEQMNSHIKDKIKLIETRNRMLQVSIEKNNYKKKVIYTLISVILAIIIIMLVAYVYFNNKK
jgi:septal ring factor EnvC (AmiA/AmiB activator)